jgi:ubiquinone/menaquinone biosynthesis C-methylase UbiE
MLVFNERQAKYQEDVRHEWTDQETIQAWRRWSPPFFEQTRAATDAIVRGARVEPGMEVLDIASGSGEPAMTLAGLVGSTGRVTATDLGPGMLVTAEENARQKKISNITFRQADVHDLPFGDASFDRVTCRFGAMYFANVPKALREVWRVLRPGGRASMVVWGTKNQPLFESTVEVMMSHLLRPPPPPPDAPQIFRFAPKGSLKAALEEAGLREVEEEALEVPWPWPGTAESLWNQFREIAAPFRPMIAGFTPDKREQIFGDVVQALRRYEKDGKIEMNAKINLATAVS